MTRALPIALLLLVSFGDGGTTAATDIAGTETDPTSSDTLTGTSNDDGPAGVDGEMEIPGVDLP